MFFNIRTASVFLVAMVMAGVFVAPNVKAAAVGEMVSFNVDQSYDASARSKVLATLVAVTPQFYCYIETDFWNAQTPIKKDAILANMNAVSAEFNSTIYPKLTAVFGFEPRPGIDGDNKITLLFTPMGSGMGGYFRSADEYAKMQIPSSNEREMLYFPITQADSLQLKVFLAHEFTHMITFNQKDATQGVVEDIWLNEARADYTSTLLGYDDAYEGSNLQKRVQDFLVSPNNSLTEWENAKYDYAALSLFTHYLVDHYGISVLADSLKSKLVGIASINEALIKTGAKENFAQIFTNWTIASVINNCATDIKYCYRDKNLTNLKVSPGLIFLPLVGDSSLSMNNATKNWTANWQKIIGGNGDLKLQFAAAPSLNFVIPYIVYDKSNNYVVKFLSLDNQSKGQIVIKDFGSKYNSLVVMPLLESKMSGFDGVELAYPYVFTVSVTQTVTQDDPALIKRLQDQIAVLKKQIADILAGREQIQNPPITPDSVGCTSLQNNLYLGVVNSGEVSCLQKFLKLQGVEIYPEGFVTGFFGGLTRAAVIRFQEKYALPTTGFVGVLTRTKINSLLHGL